MVKIAPSVTDLLIPNKQAAFSRDEEQRGESFTKEKIIER